MENPLLVFVSSVIKGMEAARKAARKAIHGIPVMRPWLFEFSSASSLPLDESYRSKVRACDIFVLLLKDKVSDPVKAEVSTAKAAGKPILVFLQEGAPPDVVNYALSLGVKYAQFGSPQSLNRAVSEAVGDELLTGYRRHQVPSGDLSRIGDFLDRLKTETVVAQVSGSGSAAQMGSIAAGAGGFAVGRDISGGIHIGTPHQDRTERE